MGFTGSGRMFNRTGEFRRSSNEEVESEYEKRRQCLYDQYTNYIFGGEPLSQDKDQEENAADLGGILLAYLAYNGWHENEERNQAELELENLPNFNYTTDQLFFFIEYAQYWCTDTYEPIKSYVAASDEHSPDEFGTFVPLTNLHAFS